MEDPASTQASQRSILGLTRELNQFRTQVLPHPSRGGSRGFPLYQRLFTLNLLNHNFTRRQAAASIQCSARSICRWTNRVIPYTMTGGIQRLDLTGSDQLLMAICFYIYPDATSDEACLFIHANGGDVYKRQAITKQCKELGLTRKRSSKEAIAAYSPSSLQRHRWYISLPPPLGMHDISVSRLIDIDETSFYLKQTQTKYGRSHTTCRTKYPGYYSRGGKNQCHHGSGSG